MDNTSTNDSAKDPYTQRVVTKMIGKPIWEFDSLQELVQAFLFVVNGTCVPLPFRLFIFLIRIPSTADHRKVAGIGVSHGDISAGNVMIRVEGKVGSDGKALITKEDYVKARGFIADFELAAIGEDDPLFALTVMRQDLLTPRLHEVMRFASKSAPGDGITVRFTTLILCNTPRSDYLLRPLKGTAIFMATELLFAIQDNTKEPIMRTFMHDAESLGWVFFYAVYKYGMQDPALKNGELKKGLRTEFEGFFSAPDVATLSNRRTGLPSRTVYLEPLEGETARIRVPRSIRYLVQYVREVARREDATWNYVASAIRGVLSTWNFLSAVIRKTIPEELDLEASELPSLAPDAKHNSAPTAAQNTPMLVTPKQSAAKVITGSVALEQYQRAARVFTPEYRLWVTGLAAMEHMLSGGSLGSEWEAVKRELLEDINNTKVSPHIK